MKSTIYDLLTLNNPKSNENQSSSLTSLSEQEDERKTVSRLWDLSCEHCSSFLRAGANKETETAENRSIVRMRAMQI